MITTKHTDISASAERALKVPLGAFPSGLNVPMPSEGSTPVEYAEALGEAYLSFALHNHRKNGGHYLTPTAIARFMAEHSSYLDTHIRVLDPGSGTGILSAAVCEAAHSSRTVKTLNVDAYETDPLLARHGDFVLEYAAALEATSKANGYRGSRDRSMTEYDLVISNPPYFKIGKDVSAFPDFRQFKQHVDRIAWETEVWIAEIPDHLIHFNGDKFLGPKEYV